MGDVDHLARLRSGVDAWNAWRLESPEVRPELGSEDLHSVELDGIDLRRADLARSNLTHAFFHGADLSDANLCEATLVGANFCRARLRNANLACADLHRANFDRADLTGADLSGANLERTLLVGTIVSRATFAGCQVYGASVWDLDLAEVADQSGLLITKDDRYGRITVDNLQVAQFVYLLLHNSGIRDVIDTVAKKGVLLIGRLSGSGGEILQAIRDELKHKHHLLPIVFEFPPLPAQDTMRTVSTLAHLSRFVIADLTSAQSVLQELSTIVRDLAMLPVQPLLHESAPMPPMADAFLVAPSVLKPYRYSGKAQLLHDLAAQVIGPADQRARENDARVEAIRREYLPWQGSP